MYEDERTAVRVVLLLVVSGCVAVVLLSTPPPPPFEGLLALWEAMARLAPASDVVQPWGPRE